MIAVPASLARSKFDVIGITSTDWSTRVSVSLCQTMTGAGPSAPWGDTGRGRPTRPHRASTSVFVVEVISPCCEARLGEVSILLGRRAEPSEIPPGRLSSVDHGDLDVLPLGQREGSLQAKRATLVRCSNTPFRRSSAHAGGLALMGDRAEAAGPIPDPRLAILSAVFLHSALSLAREARKELAPRRRPGAVDRRGDGAGGLLDAALAANSIRLAAEWERRRLPRRQVPRREGTGACPASRSSTTCRSSTPASRPSRSSSSRSSRRTTSPSRSTAA